MALPPKVARLLDANLNRAREGLRVIEDAARFLWNDKKLYERWRSLRHELHDVTAKHYAELVSARESLKDVGRQIKEPARQTAAAVFAANIRRAQEAVRVLEEYGKVFSPKASARFKKIRYQLYQDEKKLSRYL